MTSASDDDDDEDDDEEDDNDDDNDDDDDDDEEGCRLHPLFCSIIDVSFETCFMIFHTVISLKCVYGIFYLS